MSDRPVDIGALRVFEAAGRLGSLTGAARELGISQPSASYQVSRLEAQVGVPLLRRLHRGTGLTDEGLILFEAVSAGIGGIDRAVDTLRRRRAQPSVRLLTDFGFATFWLMPRVAAFRRQNPGTEVHIIASQEPAGDLEAVADLGVVCGRSGDFGAAAALLIAETVVPVCAPAFARRRAPLGSAADIAAAPLLHLDSASEPRWLTWARFFHAHGIDYEAGTSDLGLNTYNLVVQAAIAEQGIALGWIGLIDRFLEDGTLVPVGPRLARPDWGYWLVPARSGSAAAKPVADWLVREVRA